MPSIEIDDDTDRYLSFAAEIAGLSKGQIVAKLVVDARSRLRAPLPERGDREEPKAVRVYADYAGHRTYASFVPGPGRMEITSGPLAGQVFKTPSQAARAIVGHHKPEVSPHRNGWSFFLIEDSNVPLQSLRHR
ncbi:hypothetical protein ACIBO1_06755 [Micromonospora sp. NPDC049903]|uniref:hypothetical protein n=1 Tax=Micromonospora sp. NPDC049903 TaxID=3364276 RepID=UPI0037A3C5C3